MEINRNNYEAYFIDYLEGNLDKRLVDSFIEFIQSNPDLKEELALFESVSAVPENISFSKKDSLYKEKYDSEKEFNTAAVASLEGEISEEEKFEFEVYLAEHPEKKKEAALFSQTKLQADESITFNKKNKLYRKSIGKVVLLWSSRVAAVLILGLAIFALVNNNSNKIVPENKMAEIIQETPQDEIPSEIEITPVEEKNSVAEKLSPKPAVKIVASEKKTTESISETVDKETGNEYLALTRVPIEIPSELNSISASLNVQTQRATMATMYISYPKYDKSYDERLLVDVVKEKTGFSFRKVGKAGLKLFANISNERFTYPTTEDGKVKEYKYDSRLLAFSIPNKKVQPE